MKENHTGGYTEYVKYVVIAALTAAWISAGWTGFVLGVVPYSPGNENDVLLLGYTRAEWGIIHSWLSVGAVSMTAVEILITRKSLREFVRYLTEPQGKEVSD